MQACHYCKKAAGNTIDHIVPRALLPKEYPNALPMRFHQHNKVPACGPCNNKKGSNKSNCDCPRCREAWRLAKFYLEPLGWRVPPVVTVEEITNGRTKYLKAEILTNEVIDIRVEYPDWPDEEGVI